MPLVEEHIHIDAAENWQLGGTLFFDDAANDDAPIILISGAAGAPHGFYAHYARYLIDAGAAAILTYDYRGMGASAGQQSRWSELRMFHWAQHDFPAAADFLTTRFPHKPLLGLGHSFGGQALGLSGIADKFERYATVATMSGYWRNLDTPWSVWVRTQIVARAIVATLGYVPKSMGLGDRFPGKVMNDWRIWINEPEYWFERSDVPGLENFDKVTLPYLSIGLTDDLWGTPKAVDSFMKHYSSTQFHQVWLSPNESGPIAHLGFFRRSHRETHWPVSRDFLLQGTVPKSATSRDAN